MAEGRWDRSLVRSILKRDFLLREHCEKLLHEGNLSGQQIAKKLGFPKSTWVSAVKKNPIPGGVLDPKGKLAKHEGEWIDNAGTLQPWAGFQKGTTNLPLRTRVPKPTKATKDKAPAKVLGFIRGGSEKERDEKKQEAVEETSTPGKKEAPYAPHAGLEPPPMGDPLASEKRSDPRSKIKGQLAKMRRLIDRKFSLDDHVDLLIKHAKNISDNPGASMKALEVLAEIRGITKAIKDPAAGNLGASALFRLPKGSMPGLGPVGAVPMPGAGLDQGPALGGDHAEDSNAAPDDPGLHDGAEDVAPHEDESDVGPRDEPE